MTDHDIPWPTIGDTAFTAGPGFENVDLRWLRNYADDEAVAEGFKRVADLAVAALEAGTERSHERLFFPVAYAYRHAVELWLKTLIRLGQALDIVVEPLERELGGHDLAKLWVKARYVLERFYRGDDPAPLLAAERVVMEFHSLDGSGQEFRYARDKKNRAHLSNAPAHANLLELSRVMAGVGTFFESCSMGLGVAVDNHREMKATYEAEQRAQEERDR
jgi:hypothetical protein